jgi:16S rRNA (guanine1207-N2)-methyltransferase
LIIAAPPGTLERRFVLAHAIRALRAGGEMTALAPKNRGGGRLAAELTALGCDPIERAKHHHRICVTLSPAHPRGIEAAIAVGGPQMPPGLGLWSQPGVFSWDRLDGGSGLLLQSGFACRGRGADLGCGVGVLARAVLASEAVESLMLVDLDRRAIEAARRNVEDERATFLHGDVRDLAEPLTDLDFVVMNPPFHIDGRETRALGKAFIAAAAGALRKGGLCRMVANAALPYELELARHFASVTQIARGAGYKLFEAVR